MRCRRDPFYRLSVFPIEIPALRDRREDIPILVWHFVKSYEQAMNKRIDKILTGDMEALIHHGWPGNVRELQNVVERSMVASTGSVLSLSWPTELKRADPGRANRTLADAERDHILQVLRSADWVLGGPHGAAVRLGVKRTTLLYKMRRLPIDRPLDAGHGSKQRSENSAQKM